MRIELLKYLECLSCRGALSLPGNLEEGGSREIKDGALHCDRCGVEYPILRSVPRFVRSDDYAASFSFQWEKFPTLQVDSVMGNNLSRKRFYDCTRWPEALRGERILEAGCGAGRFTQLALETGAEVFSFDLSSAVDTAYANNNHEPRLHVFQASIYELPLRQGLFDKIFCMGMIQHCPDPKKAFLSLLPFLRPGGAIVIDVYSKTGFPPPLKYWVRPITRRMPPRALYAVLSHLVPLAFEIKSLVHRAPAIGPRMAELIPIGPLSHAEIGLHYSDSELKQVKVLSAFDMLSPRYDLPQKIADVHGWFEEAGIVGIETRLGYNGINARGRKPLSHDQGVGTVYRHE
jgi:SAM-dependent methyltransferase